MKALSLLLISSCLAGTTIAQISQGTLSMFAKKSLPYEAPAETFTDQYLDEGEATTIPYKELTKEQLTSISGSDYCRCTAYAVDQIELKAGKKGLIVYQINEIDVIPYEELTYHMYIVDGSGKPIDNTTLNAEFFSFTTSGSDEISISEVKNSYIAYGEFDDTKERIFIEATYETSESIQADFGQERTTILTEFQEIVATGKIVDVTVYMEN